MAVIAAKMLQDNLDAFGRQQPPKSIGTAFLPMAAVSQLFKRSAAGITTN